jgi:hypothetical protein
MSVIRATTGQLVRQLRRIRRKCSSASFCSRFVFASYHSKTEVSGNTLKYTRTFEIKELSVPMSKMDELKKFYRIIASDERNTAVLKPATTAAAAN